MVSVTEYFSTEHIVGTSPTCCAVSLYTASLEKDRAQERQSEQDTSPGTITEQLHINRDTECETHPTHRVTERRLLGLATLMQRAMRLFGSSVATLPPVMNSQIGSQPTQQVDT